MRAAASVLVGLLTLASGNVSAHTPKGFPCGEWLTENASGIGWVVVEIQNHPVGCTNPVRTITLDGQEIVPFYLGTNTFLVRASAGTHTIYVEDFCSCPGSGCVACSSLVVVIQ